MPDLLGLDEIAMEFGVDVIDKVQELRNHDVLILVHQLVHLVYAYQRVRIDFRCDAISRAHMLKWFQLLFNLYSRRGIVNYVALSGLAFV